MKVCIFYTSDLETPIQDLDSVNGDKYQHNLQKAWNNIVWCMDC